MKYQADTTMPLMDALMKLSPESSKTSLKEWVSEGRILIDGEPARKINTSLKKGQTITLGPRFRFLDEGIRILYEDSDLVVIDKPAGLLSVATDYQSENTAHAFLKKEYRNKMVHIIHRLDQETSGVMLFAFSTKGKEGLKDLFKEHDLVREYTAIIEGHLEQNEGTWTSYLYEMPNYKVYVTNDTAKGQIAITHYRVEKIFKNTTKITLRLETGRKNQIRVQCQETGHPVVGDSKYGAKTNPIRRLCLHASRLEFVHPVTKKKLAFFSPLPEKFDRWK